MKKALILIIFIFFTSNYSSAELKLEQEGNIEFATYHSFDLSSVYEKKYLERPLKGKGKLYLPKNIGENKVPLMILLHTSGGVKSNREVRYAKYFNKLGYAAYIVNTYKTRKCNPSGDSGPWRNCIAKITTIDFATDAYQALKKLSTHPNINIDTAGVIGFSYGGNATALVLDSKFKNIFSPNNKFIVNISVYGDCFLNYGDLKKTTGADFHYIIGTKDLQYNKEICDKNFSKISTAGSNVSEHFLEGGVHGFEADYSLEWLPSSEYPTFTNCDLQFLNDGTYLETTTNNKIKMEANEELKTKFKKRKTFVFKTIKKCYGSGNNIGSQGKIFRENLELLKKITSNYLD